MYTQSISQKNKFVKYFGRKIGVLAETKYKKDNSGLKYDIYIAGVRRYN